jgi:hypothetical protein
MKQILLTQGKVALVDDEDFDYLNQWKWFAQKAPRTWYVCRNTSVKDDPNGRLAGTTFHKGTKKWQAQVTFKSKRIYIGIFNTEQEAHEAYLKAVKELPNGY